MLLTTGVVAAALAMIVLHDTHGVGLFTGLALSMLLRVRRANQATAVTHPE